VTATCCRSFGEVPVVAERLTVSVEEAGELLGISRGHAYELVRRNELPHLRLGRRLVVPLRPLMALINGTEGSRTPESDDAAFDQESIPSRAGSNPQCL
jgi:excisionase family DNA binding protein